MKFKKIIYLAVLVLGIFLLSSNPSYAKSKKYRKLMRNFVINISKYAKKQNNSFIVIPQNAPELLAKEKYKILPDREYLNAIDGIGIESLNYGYNNSRIAREEYFYKIKALKHAKEANKKILVIEYSMKKNRIRLNRKKKERFDFITYHAPNRELDRFPKRLKKSNKKNIKKISDIKNFSYLINPRKYSSKKRFLKALNKNNYDLIVIDPFFFETRLTKKDINSLKYKKNGKKRLIIAYLSIGEAEDYRDYWKKKWMKKYPGWIVEENPNWPGNYVVKYWYRSWKKIIFGREKSYLDKIIKTGFDGVYLDTIDSYEYFQNKES